MYSYICTICHLEHSLSRTHMERNAFNFCLSVKSQTLTFNVCHICSSETLNIYNEFWTCGGTCRIKLTNYEYTCSLLMVFRVWVARFFSPKHSVRMAITDMAPPLPSQNRLLETPCLVHKEKKPDSAFCKPALATPQPLNNHSTIGYDTMVTFAPSPPVASSSSMRAR